MIVLSAQCPANWLSKLTYSSHAGDNWQKNNAKKSLQHGIENYMRKHPGIGRGKPLSKVTTKVNQSVEIVIPAYNAESTVATAIDSVLSQRLPGGTTLGITVVDDCSTDNCWV